MELAKVLPRTFDSPASKDAPPSVATPAEAFETFPRLEGFSRFRVRLCG